MDQPRSIRRLIAIAGAALVVLFLAIGVLAWYVTREAAALSSITEAYGDGEDATVVSEVDRFAQKYPITSDNVWVLLWKAAALHRSGQKDTAIQSYADGLARMETLTNNVSRQEYVGSYLQFAELLREERRFDTAKATVEKALRLEPQNIEAQIFLGQLMHDGGQTGEALAHYRKQLASSLPVAEERAVLAMKIAALSSDRSHADPVEHFESLPLYLGLSIGLVPMNEAPPGVGLEDVCAILEMSWRVRCDVLPAVEVPTDGVWVSARGQYDADALLDELSRRLAWPDRRHSHIVALTEYDIFGPQTSYVFSWQRRNDEHGEAVLSTSRLAGDLASYYEPDVVATRRVAIQALSTTGSMFRFERPTDAECPLAYPDGLRSFQMKRLRLCESEEQQRDSLLQRRGGESRPMGKTRAQAITRVLQRYFIE